jgi:hypothetical protein
LNASSSMRTTTTKSNSDQVGRANQAAW